MKTGSKDAIDIIFFVAAIVGGYFALRWLSSGEFWAIFFVPKLCLVLFIGYIGYQLNIGLTENGDNINSHESSKPPPHNPEEADYDNEDSESFDYDRDDY